MSNKEFKEAAKTILTKYGTTPLKKRWEEAVSFGIGADAIAYWIRDSEDVVNIVWLSPDSIRDITWFPILNQSTFNFLPLQNIAAFEVREATEVAKRHGFVVEGNLLIRIYCSTKSGDLAWVSSTEEQERNLRAFVSQVLKAYASSKDLEQHDKPLH